MTKALCLAAAMAATATAGEPVASGAGSCAASTGGKPRAPSFCAIPRTPTDVKPPAFYKSAVTDIRVEGRDLRQETAPETFGLPADGAESFVQSGRAAVAGATSWSAPSDTESFVGEARRQVVAPAKPHRNVPQPQ